MKTDWRKNGEVVRERGRQCIFEYARKELRPGAEFVPLWIPAEWFKFGFVNGYEPERWLTWGEQFKRLTPEERLEWRKESFARDDEPKNGRPFGGATRQAATIACWFYEAWRKENQRSGIKDYGRRGEMKYLAAEFIVLDFFAWMFAVPKFAWRLEPAKDAESFVDTVRMLMDKPQGRRDLGVDWMLAELDILVSYHEGLITQLPPKPPENSWVLEMSAAA
jgi:hypothetical protein